jgi:hypothetical protein
LTTTPGSEPPLDAVPLRFLVVGELPLVVAGVGAEGRGPRLHAALRDAGLLPVRRFLGAELARGTQVGFVLGRDELRLVDVRDEPLLRAPRAGVDAGWLRASGRLRGTMTIVVSGAPLALDLPPRALAEELDVRAAAGELIGAIVGVAEERPTLPLLFG